MMSADEQQAEEMTVLQSIYEGDQNFKQLDEKTYQYKFSSRGRSFIVEVAWSLEYPNEKPYFNLDIFYNQHLKPSEREKILNILDIEAEHWLGYAMTYSLFEKVKEKVSFIFDLPDEDESDARTGTGQSEVIKPVKKEQLSKAQKRRTCDSVEKERGGEKPRGRNWIDFIKHLPQKPAPKYYFVTNAILCGFQFWAGKL